MNSNLDAFYEAIQQAVDTHNPPCPPKCRISMVGTEVDSEALDQIEDAVNTQIDNNARWLVIEIVTAGQSTAD